MALGMNSIRTEARPIIPTDVELVASEALLEKLGLPKDILADKQVLLSYLAHAAVQLTELEYKNEIKTLSCEIPPPSGPMGVMSFSAGAGLTEDEQETLSVLSAQMDQLFSQSGGFQAEIDDLIRDTLANPPPPAPDQASSVVGLFGDKGFGDILLSEQQMAAKAETDKQWDELIATLARKGDISGVILALVGKMMDSNGLKLKTVVTAYKSNEEQRRAQASTIMDAAAAGDPGQLMIKQSEQQTFMVDSSMLTQHLQLLTQDRQTFQKLGQDLTQSRHQMQQEIIRNVRSG